MTTTNPIVPPPDLAEEWRMDYMGRGHAFIDVAIKAVQWGADQELEACCKWLPKLPPWSADDLRRHRRPKPPSLKEQALEALQFVDEKLDLPLHNHCFAIHTIRRALEALND